MKDCVTYKNLHRIFYTLFITNFKLHYAQKHFYLTYAYPFLFYTSYLPLYHKLVLDVSNRMLISNEEGFHVFVVNVGIY